MEELLKLGAEPEGGLEGLASLIRRTRQQLALFRRMRLPEGDFKVEEHFSRVLRLLDDYGRRELARTGPLGPRVKGVP